MAKNFGTWLKGIKEDTALGDLADDFRRDLLLNDMKASEFPCACSLAHRIRNSDVLRVLWEDAEPEWRTYREIEKRRG